MMTFTQVVEMSVTMDNSRLVYTNPDDHTTLSHVTPVFKPFSANVFREIRAVILLLMVNSSMQLYFI